MEAVRQMRPSVYITVRPITAIELTTLIPILSELLIQSVHAGASLGFMPPLTPEASQEYWRELRRELQTGSRFLVGAFRGDRLVGSGQLALPSWPNARHRAELQKLFVDDAERGHGIGRSIVAALHALARRFGRSLIMLNARHRSDAERFYKALGYKEVGVVPGYMMGPSRERLDSVTLYRELS
jgi:GNAT superfamily N-acetyltransferase